VPQLATVKREIARKAELEFTIDTTPTALIPVGGVECHRETPPIALRTTKAGPAPWRVLS
jgi:hypothetical protein